MTENSIIKTMNTKSCNCTKLHHEQVTDFRVGNYNIKVMYCLRCSFTWHIIEQLEAVA